MDEVAPPDLCAVDPEIVRRPVEQPLHHEDPVGPAGAPVRAHGRLVGEDRGELAVVIRNAVRAGKGGAGDDRDDQPVGAIGAGVIQEDGANAEDPSRLVEGDLRIVDLLPLLVGGHEVLAPVFDPLHRTPEPLRGQRHQDLLGIKHHHLGPESAAHVGGDDPDVGLRQPEHRREPVADRNGGLRAVPDLEQAGARVPRGDDPAGLQGRRRPAVHHQPVPEAARGAGEGALDVPDPLRVPRADVGPGVLVHERRGRCDRVLEAHRGGERRVLDVHEIERVLGRVPALGDDQRHRFPHIPDGGGRQGLLGLVMDQRRVGDEPGERAAEVAQIGVRQHRHHGAGGPRAARVDPHDAGVGMGAAKHRRVRQAREVDVIDEQAAAAQQRRILVAGDARARVACAHRRKAPSMERRSTPILGRPDPAGGARSRRANSSG